LLKNHDLYILNLILPEKGRGTYGTGKKQLDYLVVSKPLEQRFNNLHIERRGIYPMMDRYPTVTGKTTEASDHAAVVAEFNL
jgi:exonuclease III